MSSTGFLSHSHHPATPARSKRPALVFPKKFCDFMLRKSSDNELYRSESFRFIQKTQPSRAPDLRKLEISAPKQVEIHDNYAEPLDNKLKPLATRSESCYFEIEERYNAPYYYSDTIKESAYCSPEDVEDEDEGFRNKHCGKPSLRSPTASSVRSQSSLEGSSLASKSSSMGSSSGTCSSTGVPKRNNFVTVCQIHHSPMSTLNSCSSAASSPSSPTCEPSYRFSTRIVPSPEGPCGRTSIKKSSLARSKPVLSRSVNSLNSINLALNLHQDGNYANDYPKYAYRWSNSSLLSSTPRRPSTPSPLSLSKTESNDDEGNNLPVSAAAALPNLCTPSSSCTSGQRLTSCCSSGSETNAVLDDKLLTALSLDEDEAPPVPIFRHPKIDHHLSRSYGRLPTVRNSLHVIDDQVLKFTRPPGGLNHAESNDELHPQRATKTTTPKTVVSQTPIQKSTPTSGSEPSPVYYNEPNSNCSTMSSSHAHLNSMLYAQPEKVPVGGLKYSLPRDTLNHASCTSLESQEWFHGRTTRTESEHLLRATKVGSFLVRNCEKSMEDNYSLSVKAANGIIHIRLEPNSKGYYKIAGQEFPCVPNLIHFYMHAKLPLKGTEHLQLTFPVITHLL